MFKKAPESSPDPLSAKPDARPFLAAQAERIQNRLDEDRNTVISTLSEVIEKNNTGVDYFLQFTNQDPRYAYEGYFRATLTVMRKGFFDARIDNKFYDPLDGDPNVGKYFDQEFLDHSQEENLYKLVGEYYEYLTEAYSPKTENKVGRHALIATKEHGRRALQTEGAPLDDILQKKESNV